MHMACLQEEEERAKPGTTKHAAIQVLKAFCPYDGLTVEQVRWWWWGLGCGYQPKLNQTNCIRARRRAWPMMGDGGKGVVHSRNQSDHCNPETQNPEP